MDLRIPVGILFLALGALLMVYGTVSGAAAAVVSFNVNLIWGAIMLAFGAAMTGGAMLSRDADRRTKARSARGRGL